MLLIAALSIVTVSVIIGATHPNFAENGHETLTVSVRKPPHSEAWRLKRNHSNDKLRHLDRRKRTSDEQMKIWTLLKTGEEKIELGAHQDIVLLLGNTGSGKTTLAQVLATDGTNLSSIETEVGLGEFIIEDTTGKIGSASTVLSKTTFPEAFVHVNTSTTFYDCPGFSDTRSAENEIAQTYLVKNVLDSAKRVKLVFVVNYASVQKGVDRMDFLKLLRHSSSLITDVDKFNHSLALVVSKVPNTYIKGSLVSDKVVINAIGSFIASVKRDLEGKKLSISKNHLVNENALRFLAALLLRNNGTFSQIGIFRRPDEAGVLSKISLIQSCKSNVLSLIQNYLHFQPKNDHDFGFTISSESRQKASRLEEDAIAFINSMLQSIGKDIETIFRLEESRLLQDIVTLSEKFQSLESLFLEVGWKKGKLDTSFNCLDKLICQIRYISGRVGYKPQSETLSAMLRRGRFLKFLKTVAGKSVQMQWNHGIQELIEYCVDSKHWYVFLTELHASLSNTTDPRLANQLRDLEGPNSQHKVDANKLLSLRHVINFTVNCNVAVACDAASKAIIVSGAYVRLSNIPQHDACSGKTVFIVVFGFEKVFFDLDFHRPGVSLAVISPEWHVTRRVQVVLDGEHGASIEGSLRLNGIDGTDGEPGQHSGSFFGVGDRFHNVEQLTLSANGGDGSNGSSGVDGRSGTDGDVLEFPDCSLIDNLDGKEWPRQTYSSFSRNGAVTVLSRHFEDLARGTSGGPGGDGGRGGRGGDSGGVLVIGLTRSPIFAILKRAGTDGSPGSGGSGGPGGMNIKYEMICTNTHSLFSSVCNCESLSKSSNHSTARSGTPGRSGRGHKMYSTRPFKINRNDVVLRFRRLFRDYLIHKSVTKGSSAKFLERLAGSAEISSLQDTLGMVTDFRDLEEKYVNLKQFIPLVPVYKTLLIKIGNLSRNLNNNGSNTEEKMVLGFLYTTCLSKLCRMEQGTEGNLIVDLEKFISSAIENVEKMHEATKVVDITSTANEYRRDITSQIEESHAFMSEINMEIDTILDNVDGNIQKLINETIAQQNTVKDQIKKLGENKAQLQRELGLRTLLGTVKIASSFLSFLGPAGAAAGAVVGGGTMILESLALDDKSGLGQDKTIALPKAVIASMSKVTEEIKNKNRLMTMQLQDASMALEAFSQTEPTVDLKELSRSIKRHKQDLQNKQEEIAAFDLESVKYYKTLNENITNLLKQKQKNIRGDIHGDIVAFHQAELDVLLKEKKLADPKNLVAMSEKILKIEEKIKAEIQTNSDVDIESFFRKKTMQDEIDHKLSPQREKMLSAENFKKYKILEGRRMALTQELERLTEARKTSKPDTLTDTTMELRKVDKKLTSLQKQSDVESLLEKGSLLERKESLLKHKQAMLSSRKEKVSQRVAQGERLMEHVQNIFRITDVGIETYGAMRNNRAKIDQVGSAIKDAQTKLKHLRIHESKIYDTMVPLSNALRSGLNRMTGSLTGMSRVALDVGKWRIQHHLADIKAEMQEMCQGYHAEIGFVRAFQNLEAGISVLIQVYIDVQRYQEQNLLASYVAAVTKGRLIKVTDTKLNEALEHLNVALRANLVIKEFEAVFLAFKQRVFPMASHYLNDLVLPESLQSNRKEDSVRDIASQAAVQMKNVKNKMTEIATTTEAHDKFIRTGVTFESTTDPFLPFFVWRFNSYEYAISQLLEGKSAMFYADIKTAFDRNAVKFNDIGILIKSRNESVQAKLHKMLTPQAQSLVEVSMTHLGVSLYRCGHKIYKITSKPHTFVYTYHPSGMKSNPNNIAQKVLSGSPMLSPFTLWRIQLKGSILSGLQLHKESIEIELTGKGQYIDHEVFDSKFCTEDLDSFYDVSDGIADVADLGLVDAADFPQSSENLCF